MNIWLPARSVRVAAWLLFAAGASQLLACTGSLLPRPGPAPARFTLDGGVALATMRPATAGARVLAVEATRAAPGYDSRHMLFLRRPAELEAFAFHEWVAPPAQLMTPLLVRALQDSKAFRVVLSSPTAAPANWRLETELLRLHQDFTGRPSRIRLTLRGVLLDSITRQALAWREFDISVDATGEDPVSGALAAQAAAQEMASAVAVFCAAQVEAAAPRSSARQ